MKRQILTGFASLALVTAASGRTDPSWINNTVLRCPPSIPPMIDAKAFVNNSAFLNYYGLTMPFVTANTVNYTNYGVLSAYDGFRFDTYNSTTKLYSYAGNFLNEVGAIVNCGSTNNGPYFATNSASYTGGSGFIYLAGYGYFFGSGSVCMVRATNINNRGTMAMGMDSLLSLQGQNVSLAGGLLNMEGFETGYSYRQNGMYDGYWGLGQTPSYNPASYFGTISAYSPSHWVTNRDYTALNTGLYLFPVNAYMDLTILGPSNYLYQVVYVRNMEPSFPSTNINVYFPGSSVVEWQWQSTNIITGLAATNRLLLQDRMLSITNLSLVTNGAAPPNLDYAWTYIPTNYSLFQYSGYYFGAPATPGIFPGLFPSTNITSEYTAYEALFQPTTVLPNEVSGQNYTNMPGRIEITATKQLDLRSSRIASLNFLKLAATNNFTRDGDTRLLTAVADYNLGVTNGSLVVSNLLAPTCPRLDGYVDVFSTRFTNVDAAAITNTYFVLMVDSHLKSSAPSYLQNLALHATNVIISDVLNVLSNITIDAYNLLITTNGPKAQNARGELNIPSGNVLGSDSLPRLRSLTNYGVISVENAAFFGTASQPYWNFVNHGSVLTKGFEIYATNFVNSGIIDAGPAAATLSATSAVLSNGIISAPYGDLTIRAGSLLISNQVLNGGHSLAIRATNSLTDGGPASGNFWTAGVLGFSLPVEPPIASLLGTTLTATAPAWARQVPNQWAGRDLGPTVAGFSNNAALGRLILDGGLNSSFVFSGPAAVNALYVDYLEFRNYMTNFNDVGDLLNLYFAPGMKIYYAQLMINGVSWAEKLNHKNDGGLNWVASYAGAFSSTNMVYPDGSTNLLNQALVESCNLDSNGNGIPNCIDPAPVFVSSEVGFAATFTNLPPRVVALSWNSIPYSANFVFYKSSVTATNWQLLTNFVFNSPVAGRTRIIDPLGVGARYYRVRVDAQSP
jgi:hypothetical protein